MTTPANPATLASWRRSVAEHYAHVRATSGVDRAAAAATFRAARESLFREHPDSPIPAELRQAWRGVLRSSDDARWRGAGARRTPGPREHVDTPPRARAVPRC